MGRRNKYKIYSIVLTNHGRQLKSIVSEPTEEKIYKRLNKLLEENKKVVFPMRFNNHEHVMIDADYELVIIKCKDEFESDVTKIRDENGEFVDYKTNDEDWIVIDRVPYDIEETFWVYGFHPRLQRKTFSWIFENYVEKDAKDKYKFKSIQVYNNKVLFECDGQLNMVLCKNKSDAIRMYNMIEEMSRKKKFKYIMFMGDLRHSKYKNDWIQKIMDLTHWNITKVKRRSTRD